MTAIVLAHDRGRRPGGRTTRARPPVQAMHAVSHDLDVAHPLELASGETMTATRGAVASSRPWREFNEVHGPRAPSVPDGGRRGRARPLGVGARRARVEPSTLAAHPRLGRQATSSSTPTAPAARLRSRRPRGRSSSTCSTTTCAPSGPCSRRLRHGDGSSTTPTMRRAVTDPPTTTRAYFRGECLQALPGPSIVAANWDSVVFDVGADPLRRVPMMEPLRGSAAHVGYAARASAPAPPSSSARLERLRRTGRWPSASSSGDRAPSARPRSRPRSEVAPGRPSMGERAEGRDRRSARRDRRRARGQRRGVRAQLRAKGRPVGGRSPPAH